MWNVQEVERDYTWAKPVNRHHRSSNFFGPRWHANSLNHGLYLCQRNMNWVKTTTIELRPSPTAHDPFYKTTKPLFLYDNRELTNCTSHIIRDEVPLSLSTTLTIHGLSEHSLFYKSCIWHWWRVSVVFPRRKEQSRGLTDDSVLRQTSSPFLILFQPFW